MNLDRIVLGICLPAVFVGSMPAVALIAYWLGFQETGTLVLSAFYSIVFHGV